MKQIVLPFVLLTVSCFAQEQTAGFHSDQPETASPSSLVASSQSSIPPLIRFTGTLRNFGGADLGPAAITFSLYEEQNGGAPLWSETQNVIVNPQGKFSVLLGAASAQGLPTEMFADGSARWLGMRVSDEAEEPRVALISVPYAFKAADADTIGGRSASEFVTQEQLGAFQSSSPVIPIGVPKPPIDPLMCINCFSVGNAFLSTVPIGPSFISSASSGPPLRVASNTMVPNLNVDLLHGFNDSAFAKLNGNNQFTTSQQFGGGVIFLPIPGNGSVPEASNPQDFQANGVATSSNALIDQTFRWQANGSSPTILQAQISLLFGSAGQSPQPTGFAFNADGTINFVAKQDWPGSAIWQAVAPYATAGGSGGGEGGNGGGGSGTNGGGVSQSPSGGQNITQPPGTSLNVNTLNNTRTVQASDNWQQSGFSTPLRAHVQSTITLSPCPVGVDTTGSPFLGGPNGGYPIYITDRGQATNSESVYVTGGTCTEGAPSGTIAFTPYFSHAPSQYTLGSDSSGIQEAINDACGINTTPWQNGACYVVVPPIGLAPGSSTSPTGYNVYDTIYFHANSSVLSAYGAPINCGERGPCLQIGDLLDPNDYSNNTVQGFSFRALNKGKSDPAFGGSLIQSTQRTGGTITIQTVTPHNFRTGDRVTQMLTDTVNYWGDVPSIVVTDPTHYTYTRQGTADIPLQMGPGVVALTYEAVLDNAESTILNGLQFESVYEYGTFNNFFDFWDDENAQINQFNNNAGNLTLSATWTGSFVFSGGADNLPNKQQQLAPVITVNGTNITANGSNCATIYNSNGFNFQNSVCQSQGPWEFLVSDVTGNYQAASFVSVYSEAAISGNPPSPAQSPWPGLGVAGLIGGPTSASGYYYSGTGGLSGLMPTVGTGPTTYVYYVVARDVTAGTQTSPLPFMYEQESSPSQVLVQWPRLAKGTDIILYDVIRNPAPNGSISSAGGGYVAPYTGGCNGGSYSICGSVALSVPQCAGFVCALQDNTGNPTSGYNFGPATFQPNPTFWPGSAVLSNAPLFTNNSIPAVGIAFDGAPDEYANFCGDYGANVSGGYTQCLGTPTTTNNAVPDQPATILTDGGVAGGGGVPGAKGRLNFMMNPNANPFWHQVVTIADSNPAKTMATTGHRPVGDPGDMYLGIDPNKNLMIGGGANGIALYIDNIGNGSWGELLTSSLKTFSVPVNLMNGLQINGSTGAAGQCIMSTGNGIEWGTPTTNSSSASDDKASNLRTDEVKNPSANDNVADPKSPQSRLICSKEKQLGNDELELTCRIAQ